MDKHTELTRIKQLIANVNLSNAQLCSVVGNYYRVISYKRSKAALSTKGAEKTGGRYNFKPDAEDRLAFPVLYCSQSHPTAFQEKFYQLELKQQPIPPHTFVCLQANLEQIWDLSNQQACQKAGIDWNELNDEWEYYQEFLGIVAYSQLVGELAYLNQLKGIKFESTKLRGTHNLALFPEYLATKELQLYDPRAELI